MNITNAQYIQFEENKENMSIKAVIDGNHVDVPLDPNNRHYAEIMRQVDGGSLTIQEAD